MDLSIIVPAYNEAERLPATLPVILAYLEKSSLVTELIVVDDGSTDETAALVRQVAPHARLIRHERNQGKGAAVRTGMVAAEGEWRYLCDADLSTPITEVDNFLANRHKGDIILGSRRMAGSTITRHQAWWKEWLGRGGNLLVQILLLPGIQDSQCGFKLFSARTSPIFRLQRQQGWGYDFELLFLARRFGLKLYELPVAWENDPRSKVRGSDYLRTLSELFTIRLNAWFGRYPTS